MNKNVYIMALLLLCSSSFMACKKDLKTYDGLSGIYFVKAVDRVSYVGVDSTVVSFAYAKSTVKDSIMKLVVGVSGRPENKDRSFKLTINPASTAIASQHYEIMNPDFIIPANKLQDTLKIKLKRTISMLTQTYLLKLRLENNENFDTPMQDRIINSVTGKKLSFVNHTIWINDIIVKPKTWMEAYLGDFSRKKLFLLAEVAEIKDLGVLDDLSATPFTKILYYGSFMQRYLNEMKAAGKTIYEDNGSEMIMGPSVQ
jgi:hypothetical protein